MHKWIFVILLALSMNAFSQDKSSGCGIGWQVTKSMTTTASYVRALTNGTFSNSIAMTSGTSGCARHDLVLKEKEKIYFVESNLIPLKREVALGGGERMSALANIWGCANNESMTKTLRKNYREIFHKTSPSTVVEKLNHLMESKSSGCSSQV